MDGIVFPHQARPVSMRSALEFPGHAQAGHTATPGGQEHEVMALEVGADLCGRLYLTFTILVSTDVYTSYFGVHVTTPCV